MHAVALALMLAVPAPRLIDVADQIRPLAEACTAAHPASTEFREALVYYNGWTERYQRDHVVEFLQRLDAAAERLAAENDDPCNLQPSIPLMRIAIGYRLYRAGVATDLDSGIACVDAAGALDRALFPLWQAAGNTLSRAWNAHITELLRLYTYTEFTACENQLQQDDPTALRRQLGTTVHILRRLDDATGTYYDALAAPELQTPLSALKIAIEWREAVLENVAKSPMYDHGCVAAPLPQGR